MPFKTVFIAAIIGLCSLSFISIADNPPADELAKTAYIKAVKSSIQLRYKTNFKKSTVRKLQKKEVYAWLQANAKKSKKLNAVNKQIIDQILSQKIIEIYLFENVKVQSCPISEMLVARVGEENRTKFDFGTYFVSDDDYGECGSDWEPGDDEEEAEEEKICTHSWGYYPRGNSLQTETTLGADGGCPPCVAESVTGENCTDTNDCTTC